MSDSESDSSEELFAYRIENPRKRFNLKNFKYMLAYKYEKSLIAPQNAVVKPTDPETSEFVAMQNQRKDKFMAPVACIRSTSKLGTAFAVTPFYEIEGDIEGEYEQLYLACDHITSGDTVVKLTSANNVSNFDLEESVEATVLPANRLCNEHYAPPDDPGLHDPSLANGIEYEAADVSVLSLKTKLSENFLVPSPASCPDEELCRFVLHGYPGRLTDKSATKALHLHKDTQKQLLRDYIEQAETLYFPCTLNVSVGTIISSNRYLMKHNATSLKGMAGGPGVPTAAPHTFAFIQAKGCNLLNLGVSKDNAGLVKIYKQHILPSLTCAVKQGLLPKPQLASLSSWVHQHATELQESATAFQAACLGNA